MSNPLADVAACKEIYVHVHGYENVKSVGVSPCAGVLISTNSEGTCTHITNLKPHTIYTVTITVQD